MFARLEPWTNRQVLSEGAGADGAAGAGAPAGTCVTVGGHSVDSRLKWGTAETLRRWVRQE